MPESPGLSPTNSIIANFNQTNGSKSSNLDFSSTLATTGIAAPGRRGSMEEYA